MIFRNQSESIGINRKNDRERPRMTGKTTENDRKRPRKWVIQLGVEELIPRKFHYFPLFFHCFPRIFRENSTESQ